MAQDGADKMIVDHVSCNMDIAHQFLALRFLTHHRQWDTFFGILWPHDPILWKTDLAPTGACEAALLADKKTPLPWYLTEEVCPLRRHLAR